MKGAFKELEGRQGDLRPCKLPSGTLVPALAHGKKNKKAEKSLKEGSKQKMHMKMCEALLRTHHTTSLQDKRMQKHEDVAPRLL